MKRRRFFRVLAAAGALIGLGSSQRQPTLLVTELRPGLVRVNGSLEQLEKFHDAYQTYLWPDWKTHKTGIARHLANGLRQSWETVGCGLYNSSGVLERQAMEHARRVCGC